MKSVLGVLLICLQYGSAYAQTYFLNGDAQSTGNDCYNVTPNTAWQNGSIWYAQQIDVELAFELEFTMNYGSADANGADGMVFVMQTVGTAAMGGDGGAMGFGGFSPSLGIEFDTFQNADPGNPNNNNSDPAGDHIAFLRNGIVDHANINNIAGPIQASSISANIEDGQDHVVRITWNPLSHVLACYFDCVLRLSSQVDLLDYVFQGENMVYWGFTGSTGGLFNAQSACLSDNIIGTVGEVSICLGESIPLVASGPEDGVYLWTPATGLDDPNSQTPVASPLSTTIYSVSYTDLCGIIQEDEITVEVIPPYDIQPMEDQVICMGATGTATAVVSGSSVIYAWSTVDGSISGAVNDDTIDFLTGGLYSVLATNPEGCTSSASVLVTEQEVPSWFIPETNYVICENGELLLGEAGTWTTLWLPEGLTSPQILVASPGNYAVEYAEGACSESFDFVVEINEIPALDLGPDITVCETENVILNAGISVAWNNGSNGSTLLVSAPGNYSYLAVDGNCQETDTVLVFMDEMPQMELGENILLCEGDSALLVTSEPGNWNTGALTDTLLVLSPGFYEVEIINGECIASDQVEVLGLPIPEVDLGDDQLVCLGVQVELYVPDISTNVYEWSTGETTADIEVASSDNYVLIVTNVCGSESDSVMVVFEECNSYVYVPNSFTPNEDGLNDVWTPVVYNVLSYEVFVFDRYGQALFYANREESAWTGNAFGGNHYVPNGAYAWMILYETPLRVQKRMYGHVVLIK